MMIGSRSGQAIHLPLLLAAAITVGCSSQVAPHLASEQSTPKQTLAKLHRAARDDDRFAFLECIDTEQRELGKALCRANSAAWRFRAALVKRFGENALEEYNAVEADRKLTLQLPPSEEDWVDNIECQIDGDKATTRWGDIPVVDHFIKRDGYWQWTMVLRTAKPDEAIKFIDRMAASYEAGAKAAADPHNKFAAIHAAAIEQSPLEPSITPPARE